MNEVVTSGRSAKSKTMKQILFTALAMLVVTPALAGPGATVSFSQSGSVTVTFVANEGAFGHALDLVDQSGAVITPLFRVGVSGTLDSPIGSELVLGDYTASSELEFRLTNFNAIPGFPTELFTGPGARNSDGGIYANVTVVNPTEITVGFNDLGSYPSRSTFSNLIFTLDLTPLTPTTHVPEPGTIALFGLGLAGLAFGSQKSRRNNNS